MHRINGEMSQCRSVDQIGRWSPMSSQLTKELGVSRKARARIVAMRLNSEQQRACQMQNTSRSRALKQNSSPRFYSRDACNRIAGTIRDTLWITLL